MRLYDVFEVMMPKKSGPLIRDVARLACVSPATVDRVFNRRGRVGEQTVAKVMKAARELDYLSGDTLDSIKLPVLLRIHFLLPIGYNPYLSLLADAVKAVMQDVDRDNLRISCSFVNSFDAMALTAALKTFGARADGIAFMAIDHPMVREAVFRLKREGKTIVSLISDIPNSGLDGYVGLNNWAVGRTAAYFMGRMCDKEPAEIGLIAASRNYRVHKEREMGFRSAIAEYFPYLEVLSLCEGHDKTDENARLTSDLLEKYYKLAGIYNVGGSSEGIVRALKSENKQNEIVLIAHGLTDDTRDFMLRGYIDLVITQRPEFVVERAISQFKNVRAGRPAAAGLAPLNMEIVTRENLP